MRRRFTGLPLVRLVTYLHPVPQQSSEEKFMQAALVEAEKGLGTTSPNPAVGAVVVWGNRIVARGHHRRAGGGLAGTAWLRKFSDPLSPGAGPYVNVQPW